MSINTPTLMHSEEEIAPWNDETKIIDISVSQTLSCDIKLRVPINFDESDNKALEEIVKQQLVLPSDLAKDWIVDDFCVL